MGLEYIWDNVNHAFNLIKVHDEAVDTLDYFLLGLALLVIDTQGLKMFWLMLVIQESFEGESRYFNFTSSLYMKSHLLRIILHIIDNVHNPLLVTMVGDQLDCEKVFATSDEHLNYLLVLAGVLLKVIERMTEFFGNHIGVVKVLQYEFG